MHSKNPECWLVLKRSVRFGDVDAAGVMHFHQLLRWCHESWEESIEIYGIPCLNIFPSNNSQQENPEISLPIVFCQANFRYPIKNGYKLIVRLEPTKVSGSSFELKINFFHTNNLVAVGLIRHIAINSITRERCDLPEEIEKWIEASSIALQPKII